nr:reverse transcriptase domain-containing protein [Tanacetum cinerariifolium]
METEARMSREAWVRATDAIDLVHGKVMPLRTTVLGQMSEIRELQAADRRRQTVISELLRIDHRRSTETSYRLRHVLENAHEDNDGQILSSKRDQETRNGGLGAEGLPDMIHGCVVASKPKTMQEAIKISTELMDKRIRTLAERKTASKRKFENTSRTTRNQQQKQHSNKRQNTGRVYIATSGGKKQYGGSRPLCAKCNYHHDGNWPFCKRECPKLKNNNNHGNQGGRNNASARVYAVGRTGTDLDANVVTEKYVKKGFPIFLAHITTKEVEDKSEKKPLPEVFSEDLPGLPSIRPVEFQIDLVPGAAPVA